MPQVSDLLNGIRELVGGSTGSPQTFVDLHYHLMILLDGKKLSAEIISGLGEEIGKLTKKLVLGVIRVGQDEVISKFVAQKKKIADELGVDFRLYEYEESISTNELRKRIAVIVHEASPDGIIIQLPLPAGINTRYILDSVPAEKDVDVLSAKALGNFFAGKPPHQNVGRGGKSEVLPPVVGAIKALFEKYGIDYKNKYIVVVGAGELVGKPLAAWLLNERATFSVVRSATENIADFTKRADIIVTGVGKPKLITGDMVKDEVVVIDAGTSESAGKLAGDVDFDSVAVKASFITPVPGGVGPLTVAMIYKNLLRLVKGRE